MEILVAKRTTIGWIHSADGSQVFRFGPLILPSYSFISPTMRIQTIPKGSRLLGLFIESNRCVFPNVDGFIHYMVHIFYKIPKRGRFTHRVEMLTYLSALGIGIYQPDALCGCRRGASSRLGFTWLFDALFLSWTLDFLSPLAPQRPRTLRADPRARRQRSRDSLTRPEFACCSSPLSSCTLLRYRPVFEEIKPKLEKEDIRFEPVLLSQEQKKTLLAD